MNPIIGTIIIIIIVVVIIIEIGIYVWGDNVRLVSFYVNRKEIMEMQNPALTLIMIEEFYWIWISLTWRVIKLRLEYLWL